MNTKSITAGIVMISLILAGCAAGQPIGPTLTPTTLPTSMPAPTSTPIPPTATPIPPAISGTVTGKEDSIANRYFVLCKIAGSSCVFTSLMAVSNADGHFEFQDVPSGEYYIFYNSGHENFLDAVKKWDGQTLQIGDVQWLVDNYVTKNADGGISFTLVEDTVLDQNTGYMMVYRFFATSPFLWAHSCASGSCSLPENVLPVIATGSSGKPVQVEFEVYGPFGELSGEPPMAGSLSAATPASSNVSKTIFSDDFSDASFDGSFNAGLWATIPVARFTTAEQSEGVLHLAKSSADVSEGGGLKSLKVWSIAEMSYLEARIKVDQQHEGDMGNLSIGIEALKPVVGNAVWWANCGILVSTPQPYFTCAQESDGQGSFDYESESFYVEYDRWYAVRIEFNSETAELTFYFDGEQVGQWQPANVSQLLDNRFHVVISSWNDVGTTVEGDVDDYIVVK